MEPGPTSSRQWRTRTSPRPFRRPGRTRSRRSVSVQLAGRARACVSGAARRYVGRDPSASASRGWTSVAPRYGPARERVRPGPPLSVRQIVVDQRDGPIACREVLAKDTRSGAVSGSAACSSSIIVTPRSPRPEFSHTAGSAARARIISGFNSTATVVNRLEAECPESCLCCSC
jgi:hypothetical protein